jgi:hypothetical protein
MSIRVTPNTHRAMLWRFLVYLTALSLMLIAIPHGILQRSSSHRCLAAPSPSRCSPTRRPVDAHQPGWSKRGALITTILMFTFV